jgi:Tfp pilus assembly protein PilN
MVNWSKRPEFDIKHIPKWRRQLDVGMLGMAALITLYNLGYVGLGLYYGEIDHQKERRALLQSEEQVQRFLFGQSLITPKQEEDVGVVVVESETFDEPKQPLNLIELAAKIRGDSQ